MEKMLLSGCSLAAGSIDYEKRSAYLLWAYLDDEERAPLAGSAQLIKRSALAFANPERFVSRLRARKKEAVSLAATEPRHSPLQ